MLNIQNNRDVGRNMYQSKAPEDVKPQVQIIVQKPAAPAKTTYYRSLPTASGLKLDQKGVQQLVEMGFDKAEATQAMQESDNDITLGNILYICILYVTYSLKIFKISYCFNSAHERP